MNLKELNQLNKQKSFVEFREKFQRQLLLALTLGGSIIIALWQYFDNFYGIAQSKELFQLRGVTLVLYILNVIIGIVRANEKAYKQHILAGFYLGTFFCTLLALYTGAGQSPYWYGLFFILIAWFIVLPYSYTLLTYNGLAFVFIFTGIIFTQHTSAYDAFVYFRIFSIYSGIFIVGWIAAINRNKADALNYLSGIKIQEANEELQSVNEELRAEVESHCETACKLEEQQQFLDNILKNAPIVIWSIDLEGKFTYTHGKGLENIGFKPGENIGKSVFDVYKGTEAEMFVRRVLVDEVKNDLVKIGQYIYDTRVSPLLNSYGEKYGYMGVALDVTDQKIAEKNIKKFRLVLDQAPAAVYIIDKNMHFEYINPGFTLQSGYTEEDLLHKHVNATIYNGEIPESRKHIVESLARGESWQGELHTRHKSGSMYWANTIASPYKDYSGNVDGYIIIQQDVSEHKKMEFALQESESLYRTLIENTLDAVVLTQDFKFLFVNPVFLKMLGYTHEEIMNIEPTSILAPEDRERVMKYHALRLSGEVKAQTYKSGFIRKNRSRLIAELNSSSVIIKGKPASLITMRDITERENLQKALEESESKYKTLVENSQDGITIIRDNRFLFANDTYCSMLGYSREELYNMPSVATLHPSEHHKAFDIAIRRHNHDFSTINVIFKFLTKDGQIRECETTSTLIQYNGEWASFFTSHDITESKRMQEVIKENEKKYRLLFEAESDAIFMIDVESGDILDTNPAATRIYGYSKDEFLKMKNTDVSAEPENTRTATLNNQTLVPLRYHRKNDGQVFPVELSAGFTILNDRKIQIVTSRDISERVQNQEALRKSEKRFRELTEMLPQAIYELDSNFNPTFMNKAGRQIFKIDGNSGKKAFEFFAPEDMKKMKESLLIESKNVTIIDGILQPSISAPMEFIAKRSDGTTFPVIIYGTPILDNGVVTGSRGIIIDISERKAMEIALRESEQKYRELADFMPQTIFELDKNMCLVYMNKSGMEAFGLTEADYGKSCLDSFENSDKDIVANNLLTTMDGKRAKPMYEYVAKSRTGRKFPVLIYSLPVYKNGEVNGTRGMAIDISDRKATEQALKESEEKYRELVETTNSIILKWDKDFKITFLNEYGLQFFGYTREEIENKPMVGTIVPHSEEFTGRNLDKLMEDIFKNPEKYAHNINENIRKNGERVWISWNNTAISDDNESVTDMFSIGMDITERKRNEEELRITKEKLQLLNQNLEKQVSETVTKLTEANTQLIRLQKENLQSQFEVLRQQVNPHFLFNSLNVLTSLIKLEPDLAEKFTEHLSKVYRYVLENKDNDLVSLQTELDFLDAYLFLLNIRFMEKIKVDININLDRKAYLILPLALQLIIENAIKHNTMSKKAPLIIQIFADENLMLNIINNLQERESHMASTGVGLKNIAHRYELLELPAPSFEKTETQFIAKIPLRAVE